jgi:hypothetical protein
VEVYDGGEVVLVSAEPVEALVSISLEMSNTSTSSYDKTNVIARRNEEAIPAPSTGTFKVKEIASFLAMTNWSVRLSLSKP